MKKTAPTFWFLGLPSAGKTTLADAFSNELTNRGILNARLDGDIVRKTICAGLGFSKEAREINIERVSKYAKSIAEQGTIPICSFITPYKKTRQIVANILEKCYFIYVDCAPEVCEKRDVKGMWKKARNHEIENFTGVDDIFEEPENPDFIAYTDLWNIEESIFEVVSFYELTEI